MNKTTFTPSSSKDILSDTESIFSDYHTAIHSYLNSEQINRVRDSFQRQSSDQFSDLSYRDPYQTNAQRERDSIITNLLKAYYDSYIDKRKTKMYCQKVILGICSCSILGSLIGLLFLTHRFVFYPESFSDLSTVVGFVTSLVSFLGLVFGLITIITKFAFPKNDEEYITTIVKAIQENDFKTIVESHRVQSTSPESGQSESSNPIDSGIASSDSDL